MGLCGSLRCGCNVQGADVVTPASIISGQAPTISVLGSGEPGDPIGAALSPGWIAAWVAQQQAYNLQQTAWTTYVPTLTQNNVTVTSTATYSRYALFGVNGKTFVWNFAIAVTGAGTIATPAGLSYPFPAAINGQIVGKTMIFVAATTTRYVCAAVNGGGNALGWYHDTSGTNAWGASPSVALAAGCALRGCILMELA